MDGYTVDAGALIAAERRDRRVWTLAHQAARESRVLTVPAPVLAQVWRGRRSARLVLFLRGCRVETLDEALAKEAGLLCARSATSDVVDATVVAGAARRGDQIVSGDPDDLRGLATHVQGVRIRDLNTLP